MKLAELAEIENWTLQPTQNNTLLGAVYVDAGWYVPRIAWNLEDYAISAISGRGYWFVLRKEN